MLFNGPVRTARRTKNDGRNPMRAYLRPIPMITLVSLMLTAVAYADGDSQGGGKPSVHGPVFDISHFDVIPADDFQQTAYTALFKYRDASSSDQGLKSFRVVNWLLAPNHSQIIDVWSSLEALEQHLAQSHSVDFRFAVQVQPPPPPPGFNCCIGSPIDDRQYSLVQSLGKPWISPNLPSTVGKDGALFVITYVDFLQEILADDPDEGQNKLVQYGAASIKQNKGLLLSYSVLQQLDRSNRYVFLEVWDNVDDYNAWQDNSVTTNFVKQTTPLLGSPFDHRLNILCGETFDDKMGMGCVPP
jgi:quinol monooxygenase YgiN